MGNSRICLGAYPERVTVTITYPDRVVQMRTTADGGIAIGLDFNSGPDVFLPEIRRLSALDIGEARITVRGRQRWSERSRRKREGKADGTP